MGTKWFGHEASLHHARIVLGGKITNHARDQRDRDNTCHVKMPGNVMSLTYTSEMNLSYTNMIMTFVQMEKPRHRGEVI